MEEHSSTFRLNGGRFYRQTRMVKKRRYGPYWYCRSGCVLFSVLVTAQFFDIVAAPVGCVSSILSSPGQ